MGSRPVELGAVINKRPVVMTKSVAVWLRQTRGRPPGPNNRTISRRVEGSRVLEELHRLSSPGRSVRANHVVSQDSDRFNFDLHD